jgi:hypothetical protein
VSYHVGVLGALQDYGFHVGSTLILLDGWETRGKAVFNPRGSVNHHTAGAPTGVLPSLGVLVNGRSDVPGPLCNCALDRLDRLWLIAAGGANHAGLGGWSGLSGNASVWGLEVEHVGTTAEPVGPAKWDAMHRFHAAVADYSGFSPVYVCQHFEWAPTRKIDFVKPITNGNDFRRAVGDARPSTPIPPVQEDDDMPIPVYGVQNDATAYYMAPRDGYVQIFHPWDPRTSDPAWSQVVWQPTALYETCKGKTYKPVEFVDRGTYDAIAGLAKATVYPPG